MQAGSSALQVGLVMWIWARHPPGWWWILWECELSKEATCLVRCILLIPADLVSEQQAKEWKTLSVCWLSGLLNVSQTIWQVFPLLKTELSVLASSLIKSEISSVCYQRRFGDCLGFRVLGHQFLGLGVIQVTSWGPSRGDACLGWSWRRDSDVMAGSGPCLGHLVALESFSTFLDNA